MAAAPGRDPDVQRRCCLHTCYTTAAQKQEATAACANSPAATRRGKHPDHISARTINTAQAYFASTPRCSSKPSRKQSPCSRTGKEKTSRKNSPSGKRSLPRTAFFTLTFDLLPGAAWVTGSVCWLGAGGWRLMVKPRPTDPADQTPPHSSGSFRQQEISCSSRPPTTRAAGCCSCPSRGG